MENSPLSFEQILNATVRMLRTTWKAEVCLSLQMDDQGTLYIRAGDGLPSDKASKVEIKPSEGSFATCITENKIIEADNAASLGPLAKLIKPDFDKGEKYFLSPVPG